MNRLLRTMFSVLLDIANSRANQPIRAIGDAHQSNNNKEQPTPPITVVAELKLPQSAIDRYETGQKSEKRRDLIDVVRVVIEGAVLVAVVVGFGFNIAQLRLTENALKATRDASATAARQADIAARQLELTHRPWLEPKVTIEKPLTFLDAYSEVDVRITVRNGGTAPAIRVDAIIGLDVGWVIEYADPKNGPLDRTSVMLCSPDGIKSHLSQLDRVGPILPNGETVFRQGLRVQPPWSKLSPDGTVGADISGCIAYVDEVGAPHATYFALTIGGYFKPIGIIERPWNRAQVPAAY